MQQTLDAQLAELERQYPARSLPTGAEVVRVAPSPTGLPHIGTAMQALIDYALARQTGGRFLLRIEDSDQQRLVAGAADAIRDGLAWLGLVPDEGPDSLGAYGPYVASERMASHHMIAQWLVAHGAAYPCFCSKARLDQMRAAQQAAGQPPHYDRRCRALPPTERAARLAAGESAVIRLAMPLDGTLTITDLIRGPIQFAADTQDDPVLLKSDGYPSYHLAAPVDDHFMRITLVVRGEEWIPSAPKYLVLYQALGWELPRMVHTPLLRDASKRKLSKRSGDTSLPWFRRQGYLPEAFCNWLTRIIWAHPMGKDVYPLSDFIQGITPQALPSTGPVADLKLLEFINGEYLRQLTAAELYDITCQWLIWLLAHTDDGVSVEVFEKQGRTAITISQHELVAFQRAFTANRALSKGILGLEPERYHKLGDILLYTRFFYPDLFVTPAEALLTKPFAGSRSAASAVLHAYLREYSAAWSEPEWHAAVADLATAHTVKPGAVFMLLRVAVTGSERTPPLYPILQLLGESEVHRRLAAALTILA